MDKNRTDLHRSKPSSRSHLEVEQTYRVLEMPSKDGRADIEVPSISVDVYSVDILACYP